MRNQRVLGALTLVNFGMLVFLFFHQGRLFEASSPVTVLQARGLAIVDAQGKLPASIQVIPEGPARRADGSPVAQTGRVPRTRRLPAPTMLPRYLFEQP